MKKLFLCVILSFLYTSLFAQNLSVSVSSVTANAGDSVIIPIYVSGFSNVGAITLTINYDPQVITWGRALNWHSQVSGALAGGGGGTITISYDNVAGVNISSGNLVDLQFYYTGGSGTVNFSNNQCEITDLVGNPLSVNYSSGSITESPKMCLLTITKEGNGEGSVKVDGNILPLPYVGYVNMNTLVNLEAVPGNGSVFDYWDNALSGTSNPVSIYMDSDKSISVYFYHISYNILINKGLGEGKIKVDGTLQTLPFSNIYEYGSSINIEGIPDNGYTFKNWTGHLTSTANPFSLIVDSNKEIEVNFDLGKYSLKIEKSGNGSGQIKINDTLKSLPFNSGYEFGSSVKIEAVPDNGSSFTNWSGDVTGNINPIFINMDDAKHINTVFSLNSYQLKVIKQGDGEGKINVNDITKTLPYAGDFLFGTQVKLEVIPESGSSFVKWGVSTIGSTNPVFIVIDGYRELNAELTTNLPEIPFLSKPANNSKGLNPSVGFMWSNTPNVSSYHFQASTDSLFSNNIILDTLVNSNNISLAKFDYKTQYYWRVRGVNSKGYGNYSSTWYFITGVKKIINPCNLIANSYSNLVELTWTDNSDNELSFAISRKEGDSLSISKYDLIGAVPMNTSYFKDTNVKINKTYSYQVCAFNLDTVSANSNQAEIMVITKVDENLKPLTFQVFQNFPNPFNPSTTISFAIPDQSVIKVNIYNQLGEIVQVLTNNIYDSGFHQLIWNSEGFSSGIYFYSIDAFPVNGGKSYRNCKKMILLR